ncbi:MAG TPA: hypothetical protein VNO30_42375 [Kofleriaceae bacterium]|nr:hypothetical protein [Kofleriaceae bacterium]
MRARALGALAAAAAALAVGPACDKQGDPAGLGPWTFTRTTLAHAKKAGRCQPTELADLRKATWCFGVQPIKAGGKTAEVDLYFGGDTDDAKLIEIQLKVRGCVEEDLDKWMRERFGPPFETRAMRAYWKNSFLWAAALMPSEAGRCVVHFLPVTESSEIERIKQR